MDYYFIKTVVKRKIRDRSLNIFEIKLTIDNNAYNQSS